MFEELQRRYVPQIDREFASILQALFPDSFHPVREMLSYHYNSGGKRLRPLCVYLAAGSLRGAMSEEQFLKHVTPYAVAVEMIHNATLIHDDIQDGDEVRRGQPTLWKRYSVAQGINCGDLLFFLPQRLIQQTSYADSLKLALLSLMQERTTDVILGQCDEFSLKERLVGQGTFPSLKNYEQMARGKTAALFELPLVGGATLMNADGAQIAALKKSSAALGLAFQIQDDVLDLWGKKGRNQVGSDIAEGKLSYLVVQAHELLMKQKRFAEMEKLKKILIKPRAETTIDEIHSVIALLEDCGAKKAAIERFDKLLAEAVLSGELGKAVEVIAVELKSLLPR